MLLELPETRQNEGEPKRSWYTSSEMDLVVWQEGSVIIGFQLCYEKKGHERAVTWRKELGLTHTAVNSGEEVGPKHKESPILVADGAPDYCSILALFSSQAEHLPPSVKSQVEQVLTAACS